MLQYAYNIDILLDTIPNMEKDNKEIVERYRELIKKITPFTAAEDMKPGYRRVKYPFFFAIVHGQPEYS